MTSQTERIDHAAEAINFLGSVVIDTHGDNTSKIAIAQVHATLALAEQQRTENLISVAAEFRSLVKDEDTLQRYFEFYNRVNPRIVEALGL